MSFLKGYAKKLGVIEYLGTWDASTNTPALTSGSGQLGGYYIVSVGGTTLLDGEDDWQPKDWIIFDGLHWSKIDNSDQGDAFIDGGSASETVFDSEDIIDGGSA